VPERLNIQAFRVRTGQQQTDIVDNMLVHRARYGGDRDFIDPALDERRPVIAQINPNLFFALSQTERPELLVSREHYRCVGQFSANLDFDSHLYNANVTQPVDVYAPVTNPVGAIALVSIIDRRPAAIEHGHPDIIEHEDAPIIQTLTLGNTACGVAVGVVIIPEGDGLVFKSDKEYRLKFSPKTGLEIVQDRQQVSVP